MTITDPATIDERPVFIHSETETLFGMWSRPTGAPNGLAVTLLTGAGDFTCSHRNRMFVRLARTLATMGFHVLRFDYHGVGLSTGSVDEFRLDRLFTDDLMAAVAWIEGQGIRRHVFVGSCFGARTALATSTFLNRIEAVALISPPVRDFEDGEDSAIKWDSRRLIRRLRHPGTLKGLLDSDRRKVYRRVARAKAREVKARLRARAGHAESTPLAEAAASFVGPLDELSRRKVPVLFVWGSDDGLWQHFERSAASELRPVLTRRGARFETSMFDGPLHGFHGLAPQQAIIDWVPAWLRRTLG